MRLTMMMIAGPERINAAASVDPPGEDAEGHSSSGIFERTDDGLRDLEEWYLTQLGVLKEMADDAR